MNVKKFQKRKLFNSDIRDFGNRKIATATSTMAAGSKRAQNDALRMLGNDLSPQRQILQWPDNDLSCGVVATTRV